MNNIREKALGLRTVELEYNSQGRLHRYRDTDSGFAWRTYVYDDRGNTAANGVFAFHYDRSEQPVAISGPVGGGYAYDAHRRRVMQVHNGDVIYTLYALDGTLLYRDNATTGETTDYIAMGGHSVGRFDETGTFTWTHSNHLGSASAATDATGAILWTESYTPFGEVLEDPAANRDEAGFTGHIRDAATGLTYAQARFYDPVTARFHSPDPVGFSAGGPGYFNRYAYTMNDPVNATDPDGNQTVKADIVLQGNLPSQMAVRGGGGLHGGRDQYGQITFGAHLTAGFGQTTARMGSGSVSVGGSFTPMTTESVAGSSLSVAVDAPIVGLFGASAEVGTILGTGQSGTVPEMLASNGEFGAELTLSTPGGGLGATWTSDHTAAVQFTLPGAAGIDFNPETGKAEMFSHTQPNPEARVSLGELFGLRSMDDGL